MGRPLVDEPCQLAAPLVVRGAQFCSARSYVRIACDFTIDSITLHVDLANGRLVCIFYCFFFLKNNDYFSEFKQKLFKMTSMKLMGQIN